MNRTAASALFFLAALVFLAGPTRAGAADFSSAANGTTAADFLNLGAGARAAAMGGAYGAAADDATALYWNPAAMTLVERNSVEVTHVPYVAGSYYDDMSLVHSFPGSASVGFDYQYFSFGEVSATDASGASLGSVYPYDMAAAAGGAFKLDDEFPEALQGYSLGASVKYIKTDSPAVAQTEAADLGLLSPGYFDGRLRWAFTARNLGGPLRDDGQNENLPLAFNLGGAWRESSAWIVLWNIAAPRGGNPCFQLGAERRLYRKGAFSFLGRAGYSSQTLESVTGVSGLSLGFGADYRVVSLDYAFSTLGALGPISRVSVGLRF